MLPKLGENSPRIQDTKYDSLQLTMNSTKGSGNRKQHTYVSRDISKRNMQGSSFRSMLQGSARTRKPSIPSTNRSPKKTQFNLAKSERPNTDKLYDSKYMAGTINSRHNKTEALKSQMHIIKNINDYMHIINNKGISFSMKWYLNLRSPIQTHTLLSPKNPTTITHPPSFYDEDKMQFNKKKRIDSNFRGARKSSEFKPSNVARGPFQAADFNTSRQHGHFTHIIKRRVGPKVHKGEIDFVSNLRGPDEGVRVSTAQHDAPFNISPISPTTPKLGFDRYAETLTPLNRKRAKSSARISTRNTDFMNTKKSEIFEEKRKAVTPLLSFESDEKFNDKYTNKNLGSLRDFIASKQNRSVVQWECGLRSYSRQEKFLTSVHKKTFS